MAEIKVVGKIIIDGAESDFEVIRTETSGFVSKQWGATQDRLRLSRIIMESLVGDTSDTLPEAFAEVDGMLTDD